MNNFLPSELILNEDSSVYHLKLLPTDIADFIIVVGDPNRVPLVSKYFDSIEIKKNNREFVTHTGTLGEKQISVLSTGMGVSNIDIVFNELDILSSIDLTEATLKKERRQFKIIRLGTTGSLSKDIPLNALLFSKYAIGVDGIPHHYNFDETLFENDLANLFTSKTNWPNELALPYAVESSPELFKQLYEPQFHVGITLTMNGFYAPQGRQLRIPIKNPNITKGYENVSYKNYNLTNLEMETAVLYAFGKIFNHQVLSISTVLANRVTGKFSQNPEKTVDYMIQTILTKIRALK
jgi:uridine phosphorylase